MSSKYFSNTFSNWLNAYQDFYQQQRNKQVVPTIGVDDAASKLAFIYEKIRNTVDYKEDHLLRKYAIARILKRLATPGSRGSDMALSLIQELIRARYLVNHSVPEKKIAVVKHIINKYIVIYNAAVDQPSQIDNLNTFFNWLIDLAACEIEEALVYNPNNKLTVQAMFRIVKQNVVLAGGLELDDANRNVQLYIAVLKSLIKADEMTVNYYLFKYYLTNWSQMDLSEVVQQLERIKYIKKLIRANYEYPLNEKLTREFKKYAVGFWILQDIVQRHQNNFMDLFEYPDKLFVEVRKVCEAKYKTIRAKVRTAIVRSVIYIFLTKIIFGLVLEFPYDYFILRHIQWLPLAINAIFPPSLMAFIGLSIKTPKEDNTQAIIKTIDDMLYNQHGQAHLIKIKRVKKGLAYRIRQALYFLLFIISFSLIIYLLSLLHFSPASMIIFLVFLTLVSFFSMRIRRTATEYVIVNHKERLITTFIILFFVPIIRVGRWISLHSSKINVFIFLMDFIIETPFKIFVRIFEDLVVFVKEKRDEML